MNEPLLKRAQALKLHGLVSHWGECAQADWVEPLLGWEENERTQRSLERRLKAARLGRFKPLADFDWTWPQHCDQTLIADLMTLAFLKSATNVILVGSSGLGKTTIAQNLGQQAVLNGHTVLFATAGQILGELAAIDSDTVLRRRLRHYASPDLLIIDEVGYLSYANRHADLLFELISRRHETKSTIITTNKSFTEWSDVFPNATCVVALIDRLIHHAEVINMQGKSYRHKEATERAARKTSKRKKPEAKT
jgi:DNA replication protein DnaC